MRRRFQATNARPFIDAGGHRDGYKTTGYIPLIVVRITAVDLIFERRAEG
jgi:hypothetical protein